MRLEYRVGALLGSIVVAVSAWYFFGRESEPEMLVTADQTTVEPLIPPDDPDAPIEMAILPAPIESPVPTSGADATSSQSEPPVTEPVQTTDAQDEAPAGREAERPHTTEPTRVVRANTGAVLPGIDLTRVVATSSTRTGSTADTPKTVELELSRLTTPRRGQPSEGRTAANTAVASSTPIRTADRRTPTLLGASRRPTAAARSVAQPQAPRREQIAPRPTIPAVTTVEAGTEYVIRKNDTLAILAELHYGSQIHVSALLKANPEILNRHRIYVGQKIKIPPRSAVLGATAGVATEAVMLTTVRPAPSLPVNMYRVQRGDTLYGLAAKTYASGAKWRALLELNRDLIEGDGGTLKVGQAIRLPAQLP